MKRIHDPRLLDHLASAYALGTLRGGARRRLETLARDHATVRAAMLVWQARVSALTELQEPVRPSPAVWTRIHNLVRADVEAGQIRQIATATAAPATGGWWQSLALWRGGAVAGVLATVVAVMSAIGLREEMDTRVAALQSELASQPQVQYVAVLNDDSAGPAMLVTFDPANQRLTLQRVGGYQEAADKSLQLWALPPGGAPRSLGVLTRERLLQLAAGENDIQGVPALAISLEPEGGVPSERGPTGPVLFTGALIQKML
ncbi:MAG: RNA polymerase subunit sigma-70 [Burkholderiales bacterium]|nr:MAG: RNA polymerase subunit sigma-70 [Burkholderiales bacterium]